MNKDMDRFWRSWRSKFNHQNVPPVIDGLFEEKAIANRFAIVFESVSVPNSPQRHKQLEANFFSRYSHYVGEGCSTVNVELIARCIENVKKGKASGLDGLMAEHVSFAHQVLIVHLSLLFRIMLKHSLVPDAIAW